MEETLKFRLGPKGVQFYDTPDGVHRFTIVKVHVPGWANSKGYKVLHTGPRPDEAKVRKTLNLPMDDTNAVMGGKPIPTLKDVKVQIKLFLLNLESFQAKPTSKRTRAKVAA